MVTRGRRLLATLIALFLVTEAFLVFLKWQLSGPSTQMVTRNLLTIWLFYSLWCGKPWARKLFIGLFAVVLLGLTLVIFNYPRLLPIALFIQIAVSLASLAYSPSISAFLEHQRSKRI